VPQWPACRRLLHLLALLARLQLLLLQELR
jgi:hypothetical protein